MALDFNLKMLPTNTNTMLTQILKQIYKQIQIQIQRLTQIQMQVKIQKQTDFYQIIKDRNLNLKKTC